MTANSLETANGCLVLPIGRATAEKQTGPECKARCFADVQLNVGNEPARELVGELRLPLTLLIMDVAEHFPFVVRRVGAGGRIIGVDYS